MNFEITYGDKMKNAIVLIALLVVAPLVSQARPLKLVCKSTQGQVKASLNIKTEFCRISQKQDGSIASMFCGVASRWDDENQIFVSRQINGLSSLTQLNIQQTYNMMMPTMETDIETRDVNCRLQEVK